MGFFKGFHGGLMNRKNVECILFQPNMVVSGSTVIMIFGEGFHHSTNGVFCIITNECSGFAKIATW